MVSISSWADLPQDLLRLVIAGLILPADCARFRAVCRSWRSVPSPHRIPWIVLPDARSLQEGSSETIFTFPANGNCIGTTDSWLAMDAVNAQTCTHSYSLHNLFTKTTVSLPELDKIIGNVAKTFKPGKGVWMPRKPQTDLLSRVIDIAFLKDKLYGLTQAEDLISLCIAFGSDGLPTVTSIEPVIKHPASDDDHVSEESRKNGEAEAAAVVVVVAGKAARSPSPATPSSSSSDLQEEERQVLFEFVVLLNGDPLGIQRLPEKFADFVAGNEPASLHLREAACGCCRWIVDVICDARGKMYLHIGWEKFTRYHHLQAGFVLTFSYLGEGDMSIKVFDETRYRRHYHDDSAEEDEECCFFAAKGNAHVIGELVRQPLDAEWVALEDDDELEHHLLLLLL
ncbi:hypothetical protein QYE76_071432 [Lolium multiflorum]|uniref:TF-B3 domain-containing protein n=1 Tax=Lolium multiflorum TaxID=4521 RepID=A0AAD8WGT9_LOLMU|nr:hypothetical protein QYE76_071432 [Lolium multiflorum]